MTASLHRTFSITMALLLLLSTTSWTVGKRYCMGRLMDVSLFEHAEDCCMETTSDEDDGTTTLQDEDACCKDEVISVAGQDDLRVSFNDFGFDKQLFTDSFSHSYLNIFRTTTERHVPNQHYPPPILVKDIQLLGEVFII